MNVLMSILSIRGDYTKYFEVINDQSACTPTEPEDLEGAVCSSPTLPSERLRTEEHISIAATCVKDR